SIARDKGLQPLADFLLQQGNIDVSKMANDFINVEVGVDMVETALLGARDILAELFSENASVRSKIRELFYEKGKYKSTLVADKEESGQKYKDYFNWEESIKTIASHRLLAMRR